MAKDPASDYRALQRLAAAEGEADGTSPRAGGPDSLSLETVVLLSVCGLFAVDFATDATVSFPRLWASGAHFELGLQLGSIVICGAMGAAFATFDLGVWGKAERVPRWLRWLFVTGMCGGFFLVPFALVALAALAWSRRDWKVLSTCADAVLWVESSGLLQLLAVLILQVSNALCFGADVWTSILLSYMLLVKVAVDHDTRRHVYLRLVYQETITVGRDLRESWQESAALVSGPLASSLAPQALVVLFFRALEIVASVGVIAVFHAGTRDWLQVAGVSIGGPILFAVQFGTQFAVLRTTAHWMVPGFAGSLKAVTACVFVPKATLDADVPVALNYAVTLATQFTVFVVSGILMEPSHVPDLAMQVTQAAAFFMWPALLVLRLVLAAECSVPEGAAELAAKVKMGVVQLQSPAVEDPLPQLLGFCQAFCEFYFASAFAVCDGVVKLDLAGTDLEATSTCTALHLASPLMKGAIGFELNMEGTSLTDEDLADLAKHLPQTLISLELNLAGTKVSDEGVFALAQQLPASLTVFEAGLNSTLVGDDGVAALAQQLPDGLVSLEAILYNTQVSDKGAVALAKGLPRRLTNFRAGLFRTRVGDDGVVAIANHLPPGLLTFKADLAGTQVTDAGATALAERLPARLAKFEANVQGTKVSDEVKFLLKHALSAPPFQGRVHQVVEKELQMEPPAYCCALLPWCTRHSDARALPV